jgi:hypothetical protein
MKAKIKGLGCFWSLDRYNSDQSIWIPSRRPTETIIPLRMSDKKDCVINTSDSALSKEVASNSELKEENHFSEGQ